MDRARTLVVSGVPVHALPAGRTADKLTIHFQSRRRSHGGDVSAVAYPTCVAGVAFVTFDRPEDAERAARKERQVLTDAAFPEDYRLTVFPFSDDSAERRRAFSSSPSSDSAASDPPANIPAEIQAGAEAPLHSGSRTVGGGGRDAGRHSKPNRDGRQRR